MPNADTPLFAPDILSVPEDWKDRLSWQFETFVLHQHKDVCRTCSAISRHSNVFRMFVKRNPASIDRRLVPATHVPSQLTVIVYSMPEREVPLCHNCLTESRITEQRILVSSEAEWNEARRRDLEARRSAPKASPASDPVRPLSSLLDF